MGRCRSSLEKSGGHLVYLQEGEREGGIGMDLVLREEIAG